MSKVLLGDVAHERKETCKGNKDGYPIVGLEHLIPEEIMLTAWSSDGENTFTKMFRKGNVLFGRRRAYLKKAAVAPFDGICSGDITVIEADPDKILPELLPFIIQNDDLFVFAVEKSAGSLSPRVKWEHLKNYEFELPDMEKQKELASILWAMDETKKSYQELIAATDELVKSQFIEMFGDPVTNDKELSVEPLKNHIELLGGFAFKSSGFVKEGIPVLRIGNINAGYFRPDDLPFWEYDKSLDRYMLYPGDLTISLTGTVGKDDYGNVCRLGDDYPRYYLNQRNAKLILKDTVLPEFITALLKNRKVKDKIANAGVGVRQANISNKAILELEVPLPNLDEQKQFADFVKQSDKSKFELEQALSELTATYKRIIAENLG